MIHPHVRTLNNLETLLESINLLFVICVTLHNAQTMLDLTEDSRTTDLWAIDNCKHISEIG